MPMIFALGRYYLSLHYWNSKSEDSIQRMQLHKFRSLFDHAKKKSKFYREYYGDHGLLNATIRSLDDIKRVPIVNKAILKNYSTRDIMTCDLDERVNIHSTSGSTGEPFQIAFDKIEDYTAHVRVFWALRRAGYKPTDRIVMVSRYGADDPFEIEKDVSIIGRIQRKLGLFRREIISIYEPVDDIIEKLLKTHAQVLWSTPSIMQIICNRLSERNIRFDFPIVFFTSEVISPSQKALFAAHLGRNIVNLYGAMESPSLGFDFGLADRFAILPNSNLFEFVGVTTNDAGMQIGTVVITNLINRTMPFIRYDLDDLVEMDSHPGFGSKYIKRILGRQDDIVELGNGRKLAHHHAYEMFRDFHECEMYKFVQKTDKTLILQLKIARDRDKATVRRSANERWRKRFGDVPLHVEFVNEFKINPRTGKFKNIECEGRQHPFGNG